MRDDLRHDMRRFEIGHAEIWEIWDMKMIDNLINNRKYNWMLAIFIQNLFRVYMIYDMVL